LTHADGSRTIVEQILLGLFEGVVTVLGLIVVVFPLAVWSVPQQGRSATTIYYIVLSVGGGSFIALIALTYLKNLLFPDRSLEDVQADGQTRLEAYLSWSEAQEKARRAERQIRSTKGSALHDLGLMARVASLLATVCVLLYLSAWAFANFYYGDKEFLSADERWRLLYPDPWDMK
jgi:hypothetical protein